MDPNLDNWPTKTQAAAFLKISEKTIERLAAKGELRRESRKRSGVRPLVVYHPDDLQQIKDSQTPNVEIMAQADPQQQTALVPRADLPSLLKNLFPSDPPLRDKLYLTVTEAARYAGLPKITIRRLIRSAALPAVKAGGWRIKRSDLEATRFETLCRPVRHHCLYRSK